MKQRRWIGLFLAFCILCSCLSAAGAAAEGCASGVSDSAAAEASAAQEYLRTFTPAEGAEKWDGQSADTSWWNAADTEFHISAPAQLAGLAALVNDGNDFSRQTVFLDRDIDLAGQSWTPIGQVTGINNNAAVTGVPFAGSFDGQGHRIIGLKIDIGSDMGYGLFAFSKGTIRNVGVDETSVIDLSALTRDLTAVGSIVGFNYGGLVSNCYTAAVCTDEGNTLSVDPCIGGIAGMNDYNGIIEYCWNEGSITLTSLKARIGGIVGSSVYTRSGQGKNSYIRYCYNKATITASQCDNLGGIAGFSRASHIIYCYNVGALTCNTTPPKLPNTAGIVGVKNTYGGSQMSYCYNAGTVSNNGKSQSIIGSGSTPTNCYYLTDSASEANGATALDKEELIAAMLDIAASSDQIRYVADTKNINDGFPVLSWQVPDTALQIVSVAEPAGLSVAYGTAAEDLDLSGTVSVTLSDDSSVELEVSWDVSGYDKTAPGVQALTGTLKLTEGIENPENLTASIRITVEEGMADYTRLKELMAAVPEDFSAYTAASAEAFQAFYASFAPDMTLRASQQEIVDGYVSALSEALAGLVLKSTGMELTISTGMVTAAAEGKYDITWNARILLDEGLTVPDINAAGVQFKNYGVYYGTNADVLIDYKNASADQIRQVVFAQGEDVDVYTSYGFRLKNVSENRMRAAMFYIEYEREGQSYILLSTLDEVIAVIAAE